SGRALLVEALAHESGRPALRCDVSLLASERAGLGVALVSAVRESLLSGSVLILETSARSRGRRTPRPVFDERSIAHRSAWPPSCTPCRTGCAPLFRVWSRSRSRRPPTPSASSY